MVHTSDTQFIQSVYQDIAKNLERKDFIKIIKKEFTQQDVYHIKENIYNLDFWVSKLFFRKLVDKKILLKKEYADTAILGIFSTIRETFFGFLIYLTYLRDPTYSKATLPHDLVLIKLYIQDVLHIDEYYHAKIVDIIEDLQADFNEIIRHWIEIDDNKDYLKIGYDNRSAFSKNKSAEELKKRIVSEDILWFK